MRKPRILWASPFHLLDSSSGASKSVKTIFKQLNKHGWQTYSVSNTVFDDPSGAVLVKNAIDNSNANDQKTVLIEDDVMKHATVPSSNTNRLLITAQDELNYYEQFLVTLNEYRPDLIFLYGGYVVDLLICHEARRRGIPIIFYLVNAFYQKGALVFELVDIVLTDSDKTHKFYKERLNLMTVPIGAFIDSDEIIAENRELKYVTFINPELSKGFSVFIAITQYFKNKIPSQRFLVVQSRGKWHESLHEMGLNPEEFTNVDVVENTPNMKLVYSKTKVLLVPSLAYDSGPRVVIEAQLNGIPVIGSNVGGIPQMLSNESILLEPPEIAVKDHKAKLDSEAILNWLEALDKLLTDDVYYQSTSISVSTCANNIHNIEKRTENLISILKPLSDRRVGDRPYYKIS